MSSEPDRTGDNWFVPPPPVEDTPGKRAYDALEDEFHRQLEQLRGGDPDEVRAATDRLVATAEQIGEDLWRERAVNRARTLPGLANPPKQEMSPQYDEASSVVMQASGVRGTAEERVAALDAIASRIAELAAQAPERERMTILRMNSLPARMISEIKAGLY